MTSRHWLLPTVIAWILFPPAVPAADWPMWRYDSGRGGNVSPDSLPKQLHLHWSRQLPPAQPAWGKDQLKLQYDAVPQPVVMGQRIFVPGTANDSLTAYDTETGKELWRFYAEGPVRFAPVAHQGNVYFVSDDGHLYCVDAAKGKLHWKINGGPAQKLLLGNHRLISAWPARGGPVLHQGKIFFTASIWPFMGIFIHAVDPATGEIVWTNSGDGSNYTVHPHGAGAFGTVAPQGHLAATGDLLVVPGGRSTPAVYDVKTGKLKQFFFDHRLGGHAVMANSGVYFVAGQSYFGATGQNLGWLSPSLMEGTTLYSLDEWTLQAEKIKEIKQGTKKDKKGKDIPTGQLILQELNDFVLKGCAGDVLMKAGTRVYTGGKGKIAAFELGGDLTGKYVYNPSWQTEIDGEVHHFLAADERLFVVATDGRLYCFGAKETEPVEHTLKVQPLAAKLDGWSVKAKQILGHPGANAGCCVAFGIGTGRLIEELVQQSELQIFVIDPDATKVDAFRRKMDAAGLYGKRVAAIVAEPAKVALPPYLANLIVSEDGEALGFAEDQTVLKKMFNTLRPYGGLACLELSASQHQKFSGLIKEFNEKQANVYREKDTSLLVRVGPLPGAANWTHQYGDAAQTGVSKDKLVKAPLGLLWFGGPSNDKILPRHGHGPSPQVAGGRLFIEGPDGLRAMDVYTGRVLWEKDLKNFGKYYNTTAHFTGAGEIGSNYVSLPDKIYAVHGLSILELDAATGTLTNEFKLKPENGKPPQPFGYVAVWKDLLICTVGPVPVGSDGSKSLLDTLLGKTKKGKSKEDQGDAEDVPDKKSKDPKKKDSSDTPKKMSKKSSEVSLVAEQPGDDPPALPTGLYAASSKKLVVFNRHTGELLWSRDAEFTFRHNCIAAGNGMVYCIDNISEAKKKSLKQKGITFAGEPVLYALDARTGEPVWASKKNIFGTFLNYSEAHDVLLQAGSKYRDRPTDEIDKGMAAYRGKDGKVLWENLKISYGGPVLLWHDKIITNGLGGYSIDLATGKTTGWKYNRQYGCNTALGSEFLLTFRSGCAGFFDLDSDSGTANLGGFRSSCTNNLIIADGVLSAPDYTRTCTCAYQNQSSLALVYTPEAELWATGANPKAGQRGYNFGAPGDRRAPNGTLWQAFPAVIAPKDSDKNKPKLKMEPADPEIFRLHSSLVEGEVPWVSSSGFVGVKKITIPVESKKSYKVKLVFLEPANVGAGGRIFDVVIQGKTVLKEFDIAKTAGKAKTSLVREFDAEPTKGEIIIQLQSKGKLPPVISGVEVMEQ